MEDGQAHCCHHDHRHDTESPVPAHGGPVIYICPMHPEIRQAGPGVCPICGMALEPETMSGGEGENPELADMKKRFVVALAFSVPVFLLEMTGHVVDLRHYISGTLANWAQFVLATPVVLWAGGPFFGRALASLKSRNLNMFTLIAMGTGTDVAMESAGVTLLGGDLTGIVRARRLSVATMRNIRQNLFFAFIYNLGGVPVAAGLLYPFFGILLSPIVAAAAMSLSSVSVITNALRLRAVSLD